MRHLATLIAAAAITACATTPKTDTTTSTTATVESELTGSALDSVVQFLVTSSASDFRAHPPKPTTLRQVRVGHTMGAAGAQYMLCGQYLPVAGGEWTPFATLKTSGYEQLLGAQAKGVCQGGSVTWDQVPDQTAALQSQLDAR